MEEEINISAGVSDGLTEEEWVEIFPLVGFETDTDYVLCTSSSETPTEISSKYTEGLKCTNQAPVMSAALTETHDHVLIDGPDTEDTLSKSNETKQNLQNTGAEWIDQEEFDFYF